MQKWKANVFVQKKIQGKSNKDQEGGSGESVGQVWRVLLSGSFGEKRSGGEEKGGYERGKDYNHSGYTDLVHWIINNCYIKLMILQLR